MRRLFLTVHDRDVDVLKSRRLQEVEDLDLGKSEPDIGIKLACFLELVLEEVEDNDAAAGPDNAKGSLHRLLRRGRVMERLAENRHVDRLVVERRIFNVTMTVLEVLETVLTGNLGAELDHLLRVVDGNDMLGPLSQQLRQRSNASMSEDS